MTRTAIFTCLLACTTLTAELLTSATARACSPSTPTVHPLIEPGGVLPNSGSLNLVVDCFECILPAVGSELQVQVSTSAAQPVDGRLEVLDSETVSMIVRFVPTTPWAAGDYSARVTLKGETIEWPGPADEFSFSVGGQAIDAPQLEFDWTQQRARVSAGTGFTCSYNSGTCSSDTQFTQKREVPFLRVSVGESLTPEERSQWLFRAVQRPHTDGRETSVGPWWVESRSQPGIELGYVWFREHQSEYCVRVEAMRIVDEEVVLLDESCLADELGTLRVLPNDPGPCDSYAEATENADLQLATYCEDNLTICQDRVETTDGCDEWATLCEGIDTDVGANAGVGVDGSGQAGSGGQEIPPGADTRSMDDQDEASASGDGSCAVSKPGSRGVTGSVILLLLVSLGIRRRRLSAACH